MLTGMRSHLQKGRGNWLVAAVLALMLVAAAACSPSDAPPNGEEAQLNIVTSFSVIYDLMRNVAGDDASIYSIVEIGEDPHEYEPVPSDAVAIEEADIIFAMGLGLEVWFDGLVAEREADGIVVRLGDEAVDRDVEVIPVGWGDYEGEPDPHLWLDVGNAILMVEIIRDRLIEADPDNEAVYTENAEAYIAELGDLHQWILDEVEALPVPAEDRLLVTSEEAFRYFAGAYGFENRGIWPINAEHEGTTQQVRDLIDIVNERNVPALFTETPVDPRPMESVSEETGVPIAGQLLSDSLAPEGQDGDTYTGMMRYNVELILSAFAADNPDDDDTGGGTIY